VADELRIGLSELLRKAMIDQDADFLKEGVRVLSQALMEMEVQEHVGAARHERTAGRTGQRNGYRERSWDTRVGTVELKVPRVRDGCYFPSLLEPRRKAERALAAIVQETYVHGVSTRRVDELVKALGMTDISKSRVSDWPDPVFCTRCYESVSTDSSSSVLPPSSTFLSRSAASVNCAGVW
jgi:putative transposase